MTAFFRTALALAIIIGGMALSPARAAWPTAAIGRIGAALPSASAAGPTLQESRHVRRVEPNRRAKAGVTRLLAAFFFRQYGQRSSGDPTFEFW